MVATGASIHRTVLTTPTGLATHIRTTRFMWCRRVNTIEAQLSKKLMLKHFHLGRRANFPVIFLVITLLLYGVGYVIWGSKDGQVFLQPKNAFELVISVVGISAAFVHFLYAQHHQDTQMFVNLFEKFNSRYDKLNEKLNAIILKELNSSFTTRQINMLYDYFNICAEEHLFYEAGYIDEVVWQAWLRGMRYFAKDPDVRRLWEKEIESGSYYHFKQSLLDD